MFGFQKTFFKSPDSCALYMYKTKYLYLKIDEMIFSYSVIAELHKQQTEFSSK